MNCRTWDELFEEYEKATLKRVAQPKARYGARDVCELEKLNAEIAQTLRELREHERVHRCHS